VEEHFSEECFEEEHSIVTSLKFVKARSYSYCTVTWKSSRQWC